MTQSTNDLMEQARFRSLLEETLFPTPNNVELNRTPKNDYLLRFGAQQSHIAELFQENTKLNPYSTLQVPETDQEIKEAMDWYFSTAYQINEEDIQSEQAEKLKISHEDLSPSLKELLRPFSEEKLLLPLLYAVDLFLLIDNRLVRHVTGSNYTWLEKEFDETDQAIFRDSILRVDAKTLDQTHVFFLLVGVPWRYMMFYGPRGYRRMMFDMGKVLNYLESRSMQLELSPYACLDYYDRRIDRVLMLDGTEKTTLAIVGLTGVETK